MKTGIRSRAGRGPEETVSGQRSKTPQSCERDGSAFAALDGIDNVGRKQREGLPDGGARLEVGPVRWEESGYFLFDEKKTMVSKEGDLLERGVV
ncbi:unnamed protein product [Gadus morhua 'NCC']